MRDFSLRFPYLIYLSIGSMLLGVLIAPAFRDLPQDPMAEATKPMRNAQMASAVHKMRDVPAETAPALTMTVTEDPMSGWNVSLVTEDFTFAPTQAGGLPIPNTGHAHLYVGDQKIARMYGPHYHIPDLPPGKHELIVTLSSNDHAYYAVNGTRIEARAVIMRAECCDLIRLD